LPRAQPTQAWAALCQSIRSWSVLGRGALFPASRLACGAGPVARPPWGGPGISPRRLLAAFFVPEKTCPLVVGAADAGRGGGPSMNWGGAGASNGGGALQPRGATSDTQLKKPPKGRSRVRSPTWRAFLDAHYGRPPWSFFFTLQLLGWDPPHAPAFSCDPRAVACASAPRWEENCSDVSPATPFRSSSAISASHALPPERLWRELQTPLRTWKNRIANC